MKVGDYVRTKNKQFQPSQIAKIKNIEKDMVYKGQKCLNLDHNLLTTYEFLIYEEDIIKTSPNIIDLIEVGDYVNGHKVIYTIGNINKRNYVEYVNMDELLEIKLEQITSILTKEQFESMEYKVGD